MIHMYDRDLPQNSANHAPLSPLPFLQRSAEVHPDRLAIVHGELNDLIAAASAVLGDEPLRDHHPK